MQVAAILYIHGIAVTPPHGAVSVCGPSLNSHCQVSRQIIRILFESKSLIVYTTSPFPQIQRYLWKIQPLRPVSPSLSFFFVE